MGTLVSLVIAAMRVLGRDERVPPNEELAESIARAVQDEPESDRARWAVTMAVYAWHESRLGYFWDGGALQFDSCRSGDGGRSWGPFQEQAPKAIACASFDASRWWLRRAHGSLKACGNLNAYVSGSCDRGGRVTRFRMREVARIQKEIGQ
jgi:hypothetical protein